MKRIYVAIFACLVILLFVGTFALDGVRSYFMHKFFAKRPAPVVTIASATAKQQTWHDSLQAVGTLTAVKGVQVTPRAAGQVSQIMFRSGDQVKKGQVLVQLDDSVAMQTLKSDQATLANAQLTYNQNKSLATSGAVAKVSLDTALKNLRIAKAAVASAKVNLAYLKIVAPFSGKLGIRQVNLGQYVQVNTPVVPLQQLAPIYTDFSLATRYYSKLAVGQTVKVKVDAYPNQLFAGKVIAISPQINSGTRTLSVRAVLKNDKKQLLPGGFAEVDVLLPQKNNVITVPLTAVSYTLFGDNLYVINKKKIKGKVQLVAEQRIVKLGKRFGNKVIVLKGLKKGEQVVSAGQLKLHNGSYVKINNNVKM